MKQTIILILIAFFNITVFSQAIEEKKIDKLFKHWNSLKTPGCAIGVIKNNKVVLTKCYGMANLDNNIPIDNNTKFSIGSLTKQFTAYCIAILIYQGKLDLNDDIRKYLPDFPFVNDTLKIKHLIYHTNGLDDISEMIKICGYSYDRMN
jgi:CubicO group peptidase (beta-lactamase class C family)